MAAMSQATMNDMYMTGNDLFHPTGTPFRHSRKHDDKAFAKKVEKRRKKNKNKKTHRR